MLGKLFIRFRRYADPCAAGNIVKDHRYIHSVGDICKVLYEALLRGFVIIRRDHEYAVSTGKARVFRVFQRRVRVVAAHADYDLHAPVGLTYRVAHDLLIFVAADGRVFPCRAAHHNGADTVFILIIYVLAQPFIVDAMLRERRDDGRAGPFEHRCFYHDVPPR